MFLRQQKQRRETLYLCAVAGWQRVFKTTSTTANRQNSKYRTMWGSCAMWLTICPSSLNSIQYGLKTMCECSVTKHDSRNRVASISSRESLGLKGWGTHEQPPDQVTLAKLLCLCMTQIMSSRGRVWATSPQTLAWRHIFSIHQTGEEGSPQAIEEEWCASRCMSWEWSHLWW